MAQASVINSNLTILYDPEGSTFDFGGFSMRKTHIDIRYETNTQNKHDWFSICALVSR